MSIELASIKEEDLTLIMDWRMRLDITKYMNTDPILTLEGQKEWLKNITKDDSYQYWLIKVDNTPIGVINLCGIDYHEKKCEWGYYIGEKNFRSLKLAMNLEWSLYYYVFDILNFNILYSKIFELNEGVIKLHSACGSKISNTFPDYVTKNGISYNVIEMKITRQEWQEKKGKINFEKINFSNIEY